LLLKQAITVKRLRRVNGLLLIKRGKSAGEIDFSRLKPSFVSAMKVKANIQGTIEEIMT
jgi:hypothetical protein